MYHDPAYPHGSFSAPAPAATQRAALPGCWKLAARRAITLAPREPGMLRIAHGRVWATMDGPHAMSRSQGHGDRFLVAGDELRVQPGQRVVLESWPCESSEGLGAASYFSWDPVAAMPQRVSSATRWQAEVAKPFSDLAGALAMAVLALGRLLWGLVRYSEFLVAGRGRVMSYLESNQP